MNDHKKAEDKVDQFLDKINIKKNEECAYFFGLLWKYKRALLAYLLLVLGIIIYCTKSHVLGEVFAGVGIVTMFKEAMYCQCKRGKQLLHDSLFQIIAILLLWTFLFCAVPFFIITALITFGIASLFSIRSS